MSPSPSSIWILISLCTYIATGLSEQDDGDQNLLHNHGILLQKLGNIKMLKGRYDIYVHLSKPVHPNLLSQITQVSAKILKTPRCRHESGNECLLEITDVDRDIWNRRLRYLRNALNNEQSIASQFEVQQSRSKRGILDGGWQ